MNQFDKEQQNDMPTDSEPKTGYPDSRQLLKSDDTDTDKWTASEVPDDNAAFDQNINNTGNPALLRAQLKKIVSRSGLALFVFLLLMNLSGSLIYSLARHINPVIMKTDWFMWVVNAVAIIGIGFPCYYLIMRKVPSSGRGEVVKLKPVRFVTIFFICMAAMYITNIASGILTAGIAFLKGQEQLANPVADLILNSNYAVALIYASLIAPVIEEIIFRGILLDKLRRFGDMPAILMTGIAFGLYHMNLPQFFYAAVLGGIFAYITIKTNTIKYTIILHMMINFSSTAIVPIITSKNIIGIAFIGMWVMTAVLIGIILFVLNIRNIKITRSVPLLKKSDLLLNPGTILFLIAGLAATIYQTVTL